MSKYPDADRRDGIEKLPKCVQGAFEKRRHKGCIEEWNIATGSNERRPQIETKRFFAMGERENPYVDRLQLVPQKGDSDLFEARVNSGEHKPRIKGNTNEIFTIYYKHGDNLQYSERSPFDSLTDLSSPRLRHNNIWSTTIFGGTLLAGTGIKGAEWESSENSTFFFFAIHTSLISNPISIILRKIQFSLVALAVLATGVSAAPLSPLSNRAGTCNIHTCVAALAPSFPTACNPAVGQAGAPHCCSTACNPCAAQFDVTDPANNAQGNTNSAYANGTTVKGANPVHVATNNKAAGAGSPAAYSFRPFVDGVLGLQSLALGLWSMRDNGVKKGLLFRTEVMSMGH
ncbi:hypothetical protein B0H13DRAFT_1890118 [Mycena leptocephala]|nr:hypothetical protein B0H13DRAFT_1890118 [Mycena leptocephala]